MKLRGMRWVGQVAHMRENRNLYSTFFVGKCEGKRPLGKWKDNGVDFKEIHPLSIKFRD
jgi:hypothetical protein